jgi:hypothetical protein
LSDEDKEKVMQEIADASFVCTDIKNLSTDEFSAKIEDPVGD